MKFTKAFFASNSVEWETPLDLFNRLDTIFGFTVDVCASASNFKCPRYYTEDDSGLLKDWTGERCWMNPPYGKTITDWVRKASLEKALVVGLLPARTDTKWWQNWVLPFADVKYLQGRLRFSGAKTHAPFPSVIAILWRQWI